MLRGWRGRLSLCGGPLLALMMFAGSCGPNASTDRDGSTHDASFYEDGSLQDGSAQHDGTVEPDAASVCTDDPEARTGTTIYLLDGNGQETGEPIQVGTEVTVSVVIEVFQSPVGSIGFLLLDAKNLTLDLTSFTLGGQPLTPPDPWTGRLPLTLSAGTLEVRFTAVVDSQLATIEVDSWLGYGSGGGCPIDLSHSLAVLQVLGGIEKGVDCYDLDQAQSVQVAPYTPLASTGQYQQENGFWSEVLIDELVVGGSQCPGEGVLVHQIQKCFTRTVDTSITLSGGAYGGIDWFVDDIFLVEVLDATENVVAAVTTYQIATQVLGCCFTQPCESSLSYAAGGPNVTIDNLVQGGGDNGSIAAGAFDLTSYLPTGGGPFFLRFTALDQGVEGALDRVFLNVLHPPGR